MTTGIIIGLLVFIIILISWGIHEVPEGFVGVYKRGGALLMTVGRPGFNWHLPIFTKYEIVQTSLQMDRVENIPCGLSSGSLIYFERIEVVNQLSEDAVISIVSQYGVDYDKIWIFNRIHHEINQFCSSHTLQEVYIDLFDQLDENLSEALQKDCDVYAPGLHIHSIRVTKPIIPNEIKNNYEEMENEKIKLLIATQHQRVIEKQADIEKMRSLVEAQQESEVSRIHMEQKVAHQKTIQEIKKIEDEIYLLTKKSISDSQTYSNLKKAEINALKFTPQYLKLFSYKTIYDNSKMYFGSDLESILKE